MSFGGSSSELESPTAERQKFEFDDNSDTAKEASLAKLSSISPPTSSGPVIAVDLDDVLSQTNIEVAKWHNETYGTKMDLSHFYYYYYWKNPFWGTPAETFRKVTEFYAGDWIRKTSPIPGAREGIQTLKDMGFRLLVVTARTSDVADESAKWINHHFPGMFDSVICTGQFKDALKHNWKEVVQTKLSKAQVCHNLSAKLLIDDSSENAIQCATYTDHPIPVLLFGDYAWNMRKSLPEDNTDDMSYDIRLKRDGPEFWKKESLELPEGAPLKRVKDWSEVVRWIQTAKQEGRM